MVKKREIEIKFKITQALSKNNMKSLQITAESPKLSNLTLLFY
jgi:hypothetical protein